MQRLRSVQGLALVRGLRHPPHRGRTCWELLGKWKRVWAYNLIGRLREVLAARLSRL